MGDHSCLFDDVALLVGTFLMCFGVARRPLTTWLPPGSSGCSSGQFEHGVDRPVGLLLCDLGHLPEVGGEDSEAVTCFGLGALTSLP